MTATELRRFDLRVMRDVLAAETAQSSLDHARFSFFGRGLPTRSQAIPPMSVGAGFATVSRCFRHLAGS